MKQLYLSSLIAFVGACASPGDKENSTAVSSYSEAHAAAVTAIDYSAKRGHEWSTSGVLLAQAEAAAAEGDEERAIQLADSARDQAELAVEQADREEKIWQERVLSD